MKLKALGGKSTGTKIIAVPTTIIGGILITADGTNDTTVTINKAPGGVAGSEAVFEIVTKSPLFVCAPFDAADHVQLAVSGTGAAVQLFEWVT